MRKIAFTISTAIISLSACTNSGNPQLSMCQAVAKQLTSNTVSSWDSDSSTDNGRNVAVKVAYTNSSGQAGTLNCTYKKQGDGNIDTAPTSVVWNNQPVPGKTLISVGTKASKELLAGTYKNTVEKSSELAAQAAEKSQELAGQAAEKAGELAEQAKDAAVKGATALQELQK